MLGKALISSARGEAFITLKGVDPSLERSVTDITGAMKSGRFDAIATDPGDDRLPGIVVGVDLAKSLDVKDGDEVTLLTPQGTLTPMGVMPRQRHLRVVGQFSLGLYEFDSTYGFVSLATARRLLDQQQVQMIELRVDEIYQAPAIAEQIVARLGSQYITQTWAEMNRALFSALWLEKMAISITIGLIVMVAALNIVASLVLLVMEKSRDIAILKTMGASSRAIMVIFMLQGLIIGLVGTSIGAVAGYGLSFALDQYQLIRVPMDVYQIVVRPVRDPAARFRRRDRLRHRRLLRGDAVPVAPGRKARSGRGAALRIGPAIPTPRAAEGTVERIYAISHRDGSSQELRGRRRPPGRAARPGALG